VARDWDEQSIVEMVKEHLTWRTANLPMEVSPVISRVLESKRIQVLRRGAKPIICVDFMWGNFLLDGFEIDDIMAAMVSALEDVLAEADALCLDSGAAQYILVATGGPPPSSFVSNVSSLLDINYPERLLTALIYPIPVWMEYVAYGIFMFTSSRTREKVTMLSEESALLEHTGLSAEELPDDLKGGIEASNARREKALLDEACREQMPEEFMDAVTSGEQQVKVPMAQAAC
jgi:hypothetical protein